MRDKYGTGAERDGRGNKINMSRLSNKQIMQPDVIVSRLGGEEIRDRLKQN